MLAAFALVNAEDSVFGEHVTSPRPTVTSALVVSAGSRSIEVIEAEGTDESVLIVVRILADTVIFAGRDTVESDALAQGQRIQIRGTRTESGIDASMIRIVTLGEVEIDEEEVQPLLAEEIVPETVQPEPVPEPAPPLESSAPPAPEPLPPVEEPVEEEVPAPEPEEPLPDEIEQMPVVEPAPPEGEQPEA